MNFKFLKALQELPDNDRQRLKVLALVLGLVLIWTWNIAPALKTLREAPLHLSQLELQTQSMKAMQSEAQTLQKSPRLSATDANTALRQAALEVMGNGARLSIEGNRATLTLSGVTADSLAQFLALVRTKSQALPIEAHVQKFTNSGAAAGKTAAGQELWRGALILSLPGG